MGAPNQDESTGKRQASTPLTSSGCRELRDDIKAM